MHDAKFHGIYICGPIFNICLLGAIYFANYLINYLSIILLKSVGQSIILMGEKREKEKNGSRPIYQQYNY
jgi:hypothetical protein